MNDQLGWKMECAIKTQQEQILEGRLTGETECFLWFPITSPLPSF